MKTEDLIAALAEDVAPRPAAAARILPALAPAMLVSGLALVLIWHTRPDLAAALGGAAVIKTLLPLALALAALALARASTRPEARLHRLWALVGVVALASGAAIGLGLLREGIGGLRDALDTPSLLTCLVSVPVLAALPLAGVLWAMRAGAAAHPAQAGAAAGVLAGAAATALYSLHCPDDAVLFYLPAYGSAILAVTGAGALIGRRLLRW